MSIHKNLTQPEAIHPFAYASNADPASDADAGVAARKAWLDTSTSPATLKIRNAANSDWDGIQVAGGVTSIAHASNTFTGSITLTTPGDTVGISSPTAGTLAFTARQTAGGAGSGTADLAGKEIDYAQITSDVVLSGTTEGTANTIITGASVAYDGATVVLVEFYTSAIGVKDAAGTSVVVLLYDGATVLGRLAVIINNANAAIRVPVQVSYRLTPTNASHQYIIKAYASATGGTTSFITAGAGGTGASFPAYMRITRVTS